jgi:N-methylhydantoinase A
MLDATQLANSPIHVINSGPSVAPIAGRHYAALDGDAPNAIVADTGGTTFDVSLVRRGRIPLTNETWIGQQFRGHMTGFSSIDIKSIGAGGGSIAWVDDGGVLHVGPKSAGAVPGPACYGSGGSEPTLTDAALVLGYLDPRLFLGGTMSLDGTAACEVVKKEIADILAVSIEDAAIAIFNVATENMVQAIVSITVSQGIDPAKSDFIGGGGAAGLNAIWIARRLGCSSVIIPEVGAALSAAGALISELCMEYRAMYFSVSDNFDRTEVNKILRSLSDQCGEFSNGPGAESVSQTVEYTAEARYANQVWEIDLPLRVNQFRSNSEVDNLVEDFHALHEEIFAIRDEGSAVEVIGWKAVIRCRLPSSEPGRLHQRPVSGARSSSRRVYFPDSGYVDAELLMFDAMTTGDLHHGPAIIESPFTTVVADAESTFERTSAGSLVLRP